MFMFVVLSWNIWAVLNETVLLRREERVTLRQFFTHLARFCIGAVDVIPLLAFAINPHLLLRNSCCISASIMASVQLD